MKKLPLVLILLLGIAAPTTATLLYFFWRPDSFTHHGEVLPPRLLRPQWRYADSGKPLDIAEWRGRWVLLQVSSGECTAVCKRRLCQMRQLRLLSFGNYFRLRRAWLLTDNSPPPSLTAASHCGEKRAAELDAETVDITEGVSVLHGDADSLPSAVGRREEYLYLIDPAGLLIMRFSPRLDIYQIRQDLARLLKLAKGRRLVR